MEKLSRRKRYLRLIFSDEEMSSTDQKPKRIPSSESQYYPDPKLNDTNSPQYSEQQSDYEPESFRGEREQECDYRFVSSPPKSPQYSPADPYERKKNPATDEEEIHSDSIKQNARNLSFDFPGFRYKAGESYAAEPLIRAAWAGDFTVSNRQNTRTTFQGITACFSSKACAAECGALERMPPSIQWEKLPRCSVWPKDFQESPVGGPSLDDIAVFFFPSLTKHAAAYDSLLFCLISDDLAMRTSVLGTELLLFTSIELPPPSRRFQGKLFLWGVFKADSDQPYL